MKNLLPFIVLVFVVQSAVTQYTGVLVMPQRGKDEWSDWGFSNSHTIPLNKGDNILKISFEDWNNNMNVDTNTAMLDYLRLIRL